MREHLYRGKRVDNGEWVYGCLLSGTSDDAKPFALIVPTLRYVGVGYCLDCDRPYDEHFEVDPNTIGQFTGLHDKNGTRIFEGAIVKVSDIWCGGNYEVYWWENDGSFKFTKNRKTYLCMDTGIEKGCTILGNIHDNPELLEVAHG